VSRGTQGKEGEAEWAAFNLLASHNAHATANALPQSWHYPIPCVEGSAATSPPCSTYYTSMTPLPPSEDERAVGAASVVVAYDRTPNGWGAPVAGKQWDLLFSVQLTVTSNGVATA
jgi:hypothetical protein